jgi:hypothetical protein
MRFAGSRLKQQFPDQFEPFCHHFGCDMTNSFNGTIFRFPLRTDALAAKSEIKSGQPYTPDDIKDLFGAGDFASDSQSPPISHFNASCSIAHFQRICNTRSGVCVTLIFG